MAAEATAQAIVRAKLVDSPLSVFYIVCKRSCWWVKLLTFFLKARLSCQMNASVRKMKNEVVCEWSQTRARAGLGVNGMINKFIYKQQF